MYAKRVAVAHKSRIEAVNAMRYHLCIDSMPADDMHSLSVEQINRVLTLALNSKFLRVCTTVCQSAATPWHLWLQAQQPQSTRICQLLHIVK